MPATVSGLFCLHPAPHPLHPHVQPLSHAGTSVCSSADCNYWYAGTECYSSPLPYTANSYSGYCINRITRLDAVSDGRVDPDRGGAGAVKGAVEPGTQYTGSRQYVLHMPYDSTKDNKGNGKGQGGGIGGGNGNGNGNGFGNGSAGIIRRRLHRNLRA